MSIPLNSLIIHCLLENRGGRWQAFSLEFGLAAQGESEEEVKGKLQNMVASYVFDALVGEDKDYASVLLTRRATFSVYFKYHVANVLTHARRLKNSGLLGRIGSTDTYESPVPLAPTACHA